MARRMSIVRFTKFQIVFGVGSGSGLARPEVHQKVLVFCSMQQQRQPTISSWLPTRPVTATSSLHAHTFQHVTEEIHATAIPLDVGRTGQGRLLRLFMCCMRHVFCFVIRIIHGRQRMCTVLYMQVINSLHVLDIAGILVPYVRCIDKNAFHTGQKCIALHCRARVKGGGWRPMNKYGSR